MASIKTHPTLLDGLLAYYKLEDTVTVTDSHGSNNGTAEKTISTVAGVLKNCIAFDGNGDPPDAIGVCQVLRLGQVLATSVDLSISYWSNLNSVTPFQTHLTLGSWDGSVMHAQCRLWVSQTAGTGTPISFTYWGATGNIAVTAPVTNGSWVHWAITVDYDPDSGITTLRVYKNGYLASSNTGSIGGMKTSTIPLLIGGACWDYFGTNQRLHQSNGKYDEIAIAARAWTPAEARDLYHTGYPLRYEEVVVGVGDTMDVENLSEQEQGYIYLPVTGFTASPEAAPQQITLEWTNPADPLFMEVMIRRSETAFPPSTGSGVLVYQGPLETFVDEGLDPAKTYYYSIFAFDIYHSYSVASNASSVPHGLYSRLLTAEVISPVQVRVTFDRKMATGANDGTNALRVANWSMVSSAREVNPALIASVQVDPTIADITMDAEGTNGALYTLSVAATVQEFVGHVIDPLYRQKSIYNLGQRPQMTGAFSINPYQVVVTFSEAVTGASQLSHYTINGGSGGLSVLGVAAYSVPLHQYVVDTSRQGMNTLYTIVATLVLDLSGNPIDPDFNSADFLGSNKMLSLPEGHEVLDLDMYRFLIEPMRDADQKEGSLFLKRFLEGPQAIWAQIQEKAFVIKDLWSVSDCLDQNLHHLKKIVGWVGSQEVLTQDLDLLTLRRLIRASIPLWKNRSTEATISDVLNLLVARQARIWNWFSFCWITGDELGIATVFGEQRQGRDPWLLDFPGDITGNEFWSTIRMRVPDDRVLVREILKLMRPLGERFRVIYLLFIDMFNYENDLSQWTKIFGELPVVTGGSLVMETVSERQAYFASAENYSVWNQYVVSLRIKASTGIAGGLCGIYLYLTPATERGYFVGFDVINSLLKFGKVDGGVQTDLVTFDFEEVTYTLQEDFWYGMRVQVVTEGTTTRFVVYFDGEELINLQDATYSQGAIGCFHDPGVGCQVDEIEVMGLPVDSETIELS